MSYYDPDEPISIVEDLDPEPPSKPGSSQRLELLVGVVLLACVLAFVAFQWWHQQVQVSDYASGQTAMSVNNWDDALYHFTQAGDYRDAAQQALHAREQVNERNYLYGAAQDHAANGEWLDSLANLRAVRQIQPDYLNSEAQEKTALQNVYATSLSGTVALRPDANPPGLYYYSSAGWVYLRDSDERSAIIDTDDQGRLVYDVPGAPKGSAPLGSSPPNTRAAITNIRYYRVAQLTNNGFIYSHLDLDTERYNQIILNANGAWGFSYGDSPADNPAGYNASGDYVAGGNFVGVKMDYEPFTGSVATVDSRPSFTGTSATNIIVAIDPQSDRYLSVDYTNAHQFKAGSDTIVKLFMNQAGSSARQLIYTHTGGGLPSAQLSPDGHYVLVNVTTLKANGAIDKTSTVLVDLHNIQAPHVIREVSTGLTTPLGSVFVREGVFAGDVALYERRVEGTRLTLLDPAQVGSAANPYGTIENITVPDQTDNMWVLVDENANGITLIGQTYESSSYPSSYTLSLVTMPAQGQPTVNNIEMVANSYFGSIQIKGDSAAWVTNIYPMGGTSNVTTNINMATLSTVNNETIRPTVVFTSTYDPIAKNVNTTPSISLGDELIAYSLDGQLHARTYSGSADMVLESGVSYMRNFRNEVYTSYWDSLR
ncbi:MAG: hypothetical protein ABJA50_00425 [Chloroflexota bacterium]